MAQIVNDMDLGSYIGKQLGTGISSGLDTLARAKIGEILERQKGETDRGILQQTTKGMFTPEEVNFLTIFPRGSKEQLKAMQMLSQQERGSGMGTASDLGGQMMQQLGQQPTAPRTAQELMSGAQQPKLPFETERKPRTVREALAAGEQTPQMKQQAQQFTEKMKVQYHQATEKARTEIRKLAQSAESDIAQLSKLEKLSDANKLPNDMVYKFLDTMGLSDVGSLIGADAQEFNKIITDMSTKIKDKYGARITNFELGTFLRSLPSLLQDPQGRKQIIKDLKLMLSIPQERYKAMREIMKENGGVPPLDIADQVEDRIDSFKKGIFDKYQQYGEDMPQYNVTSRTKTKPNAQSNKGETFKFPDGKFYHSDGMRWRPVEVKGNQISFLPEEEMM